MNKLINIVLSGLLWRKYKFLLVSLIALIVCVFLVGQIHQDYLAYAQTTSNVAVGWSFAVKWLVWVIAICIFFAANHFANKRKQRKDVKEDKNSALQRIIEWKNSKKGGSKAKPQTAQNPKQAGKGDATTAHDESEPNDPFAQLRHKEKLRSYADLIIEKKRTGQ
ncbi:hypothetical protein ACFO4O_16575 [Glaciecola siphonariae]|uniref:Uncharacterized protein n=1 Tax=Glaciecola siphonariae TaxID=521012 RepID=A0ABV9M042_9ALTE